MRAIGVSNWSAAQLIDLLGHPATRVPPHVLQSECHPLFANASVRRVCAAHGVAFQAYGPLGGSRSGLCSHPTVRAVAQSAGRTAAQVVLRWASQQGVCVLPKSRRLAGVDENAGAAGFDLTEAQRAQLDGLDADRPLYWVYEEALDRFNVFLDMERLREELGQSEGTGA